MISSREKLNPTTSGKVPYILISKGTTSRLAHLGKFSLDFSSSPFVIRVYLLHTKPSLFLYGLLYYYVSQYITFFKFPSVKGNSAHGQNTVTKFL